MKQSMLIDKAVKLVDKGIIDITEIKIPTIKTEVEKKKKK